MDTTIELRIGRLMMKGPNPNTIETFQFVTKSQDSLNKISKV